MMEQMKVQKKRRVGTFTAAILLIIIGMLFLLHMFLPTISYVMIFRCWPLILVLLGLEMLIASRREEDVVYDGGAIFLVIVMAVFAMGMAGADMVIQYAIREGNFHIG